MAAISESAHIRASVDRVFAYVTEPTTLPEWLPSMVEVHNVIGTGLGQQYEWTYKMAGMLFRGQSTVVEHVPPKCSVHQSIGMIGSTWTLRFEPHDEGTTFTLEVEYTVPVPVLGKLAERLIANRDKRDLALAFENVKEMLES